MFSGSKGNRSRSCCPTHPAENGNYLLRQSGCPRKPDSLDWRRTWKMMADGSRFTGSLFRRHTGVEDNTRQQGALNSALTPATRVRIFGVRMILSSSLVSPQQTSLCKCEQSSLCVHLLVWTLIYLHINTCRPLCWYSALRGGHMRPVLSQTKPLNTNDTPASASRPSVSSVVPLAHCCSLLPLHFNAVWIFAKLYGLLTGHFLSWELIKQSESDCELMLS